MCMIQLAMSKSPSARLPAYKKVKVFGGVWGKFVNGGCYTFHYEHFFVYCMVVREEGRVAELWSIYHVSRSYEFSMGFPV